MKCASIVNGDANGHCSLEVIGFFPPLEADVAPAHPLIGDDDHHAIQTNGSD